MVQDAEQKQGPFFSFSNLVLNNLFAAISVARWVLDIFERICTPRFGLAPVNFVGPMENAEWVLMT